MSHLRSLRLIASLLVWSGLPLHAAAPGLDVPEPVAPYFGGVFPSTAPGDPSGWAMVNAFPNLTFTDPMMLAEIPGQNEFLVVGKTGLAWRFPNDHSAAMAQRVQVLDWTASTETSEDQGFYSLVFHPDFGQAGENSVFACYNRRAFPGVDDNDRTYWTVSRFTWLPATGTIDPGSEEILISQYDPHRYHNGGAMFFDADGFLCITVGDGGDGGDSFNNSQKIDLGFFGGVLRIDVDNDPAKSHPIRRQPTENPLWEMNPKPAEWPASHSQGYGIPNGNPWLDPNGGILEEFYAIGLRSPHSAHYDPVTGDIWVGDVGQSNREELSRVRKGDNLQWAYKEGTRNTSKNKPVPYIGSETAPVHEYDHSVGASIIGGMRYRGAKWNSFLGGKVLFGDHVRGRVWSLELPAGSGSPAVTELFSSFHTGYKAGLSNFSTDAAGEIYLMDLGGSGNANGKIMKLAEPAVSAEPPQFLSQTGVFTDLATLATAPGVIPYDVPNPLWSDDAHKRRWLIVPNDGSFNSAAEDIVFSAEGNWVFPAGSVIVKHFEAPVDAGDPSAVKRLETRFLVCTPGGGKYGFTYKWNAAGTDAELMDSGLNEAYDYDTGSGVEPRTWSYPSRGDCMVCHNDVAGQALGVRTVHLNSPAYYPLTGRTANQLETLNALGIFNVALTASQLEDFIEARALDDESAPLEHRIRSYLDTNCAHCHQPGAQGDGFDARLETALDRQNLINAIPTRYEELGPAGRYIKPGDAALSAIHVRAAAAGNGDAMPPLAKNLAHGEGVAVLEEYIESLTEAEFAAPLGAGPQARYVRLKSITGRSRFAAVAEFSVLDGDGAAIPAGQVTASYLREDGSGGFVAGVSATGSLPAEATDGNLGSSTNFWQSYKGSTNADTPNHPHYLVFDLGIAREIGGFTYYPRTTQDGRIYQYVVDYSEDGTSWTSFHSGVWQNVATPYTFNPGFNKRPARAQIAGPAGVTTGPFDVTVAFDMDVADFSAADLQVTGGTVKKLRGGGYYYVARIWPDPGATAATVTVPANAVNPQGKGSHASLVLPLVLDPDLSAPDPAPADLVADPDVQGIDLTWTAAGDNVGVEYYQVLRGTQVLATVQDTSFSDAGLNPDTEYSYTVRAFDAAGNFSDSAVLATATDEDDEPPSMPEGLAADPDEISVLLSWTASGDNVAVDHYRVKRGIDVIGTVEGLSFLDTGLTDDTDYVYEVVAVDTSGVESAAATLPVTTVRDVVAPDAPENLAATALVTEVQLTWTEPWDYVGVTGYRISRDGADIATVSATSYTDGNLDPNALHQYAVRALDQRGNISDATTIAATTLPDLDAPDTPGNFAGDPGLDSISLSWSPAADHPGGTGVDRYRLSRDGSVLGTVTGQSFLDEGLESGIEYHYELVAIDGVDNESPPALLSISTETDEEVPSPPGDLVGYPDYTSISLTWTPAGDSVGVVGYEITRVGEAEPFMTVVGLGYTVDGLSNDTSYGFEVRAFDAAGNRSEPAVVTVETLGFEDWLDEHGIAGQTSGDSDHGGLDNFSEFQLGMNPLDPLDDLTFRIDCQPGLAATTIIFPELKPLGDYHLHASSSLEGILSVENRVATVTRAQIEAMESEARTGYSVEVPVTGQRAFFRLLFEPAP